MTQIADFDLINIIINMSSQCINCYDICMESRSELANTGELRKRINCHCDAVITNIGSRVSKQLFNIEFFLSKNIFHR